MNIATSFTPTPGGDLTGLAQAMDQSVGEDCMINSLSPEQWVLLARYLQPVHVAAGRVLFEQGSTDRTLYLIESGNLTVHFEDENQRLRLAIVGPGSVVGEGAFFSHRPRSATVQAGAASKLWALSAIRFNELAHRQPAVALPLVMAIAAVQAKRLSHSGRRVAST